ncbi:MAG TPA: cupin domain-containing protein [Ktedonobacterales bacterium]|jgi:quercetin dioxygenase-like cupin family protein|nr:cupin domain-containing protein [Ktedonobacterales bacterium]
MDDSATPRQSALYVPAGQDRFSAHRGLGVSVIEFKVTPQDNGGDLLILENAFHAKGGPARHLHYEQDEAFYALEGEFLIEVGDERRLLHPGDSLLAPRRVPHVWAHVGEGRGRILITFAPAGQMEAFFREVTKANAMPPQDPALWHAHGMELVGPPLALD